MPINPLLQNEAAFGPQEIALLAAAFQDALGKVRMVDRSDGATEIIAKHIIELAKQGERDPIRLCDGALQALRG